MAETMDQCKAFQGMLLATLLEGVFGLDREGRYIFLNPAACRLLGFAREADALGLRSHAVSHHTRADGTPSPETECPICNVLTSGEPLEAWEDRFQRPDGSSFPVRVYASPMRDGDGEVGGVLVSFLDETARVECEQRLARAARNLPGIIYQCRIYPDGRLELPYASEGFSRTFGVSHEELTREAGGPLARVHPDDLDQLQATIDDSVQNLRPWQATFRVWHPERGWIWIMGRSTPEVLPDHSVLFHGVMLDVTERIELEEALRQLAAIIDRTPDLVAMQGPDEDVQFLNAAGRRLLGLPELSGDPWQPGTGWNTEGLPREAGSLKGTIRRVHPAWAVEKIRREGLPAALRDGVWKGETALLDGAGREVPVSQVIMSHRDRQGRKRQLSTIMRYISGLKSVQAQLERSNAALERLAFYDRLTGVANRHYFEKLLDRELQRADRYGAAFALVMFDLDHFKAINDTNGHATGDTVLQEVTRLVGERLRESDVLGRWGGEEFMVLLPGNGPQQAARVAREVRRRVAEHPFPEVGRVTISLGVAVYRPGEPRSELLRRVDDALYRAKREGRNRLAVAEF